MSRIAFITTCKGRLHHLQRSLQHMVAQPDSTVVMVDYDCPDRSGDWVESRFPSVRVIREIGQPKFNPSRARNIGAAAANAEWLCFIDADITPTPGFVQTVTPLLGEGCYLHGDPFVRDMYGTFLCRKEDFKKVGGYDDIFDAWSQEDKDLYIRLEAIGLRRVAFLNALLVAETHTDELRTRYFGTQDIWLGMRTNALYVYVKSELIRLLGEPLDAGTRRTVYEEVKRSIASNPASPEFNITLPPRASGELVPGWQLTRQLILKLQPDLSATPDVNLAAPQPMSIPSPCGDA